MFYDEYIKLCNQIGRSPSAVAETLGFQKSAVTRWKQGSTPTDNNKRKIAEFFGVPVSTFLTPTSVPPASAPAGQQPAGSPVLSAPELQPYPTVQPSLSPIMPSFATPAASMPAATPVAPTSSTNAMPPQTPSASSVPPVFSPASFASASASPSGKPASPVAASGSPIASVSSTPTSASAPAQPIQLKKPVTLSDSTSSIPLSQKENSSAASTSHTDTSIPAHAAVSPSFYDKKYLKIVLFGDPNIGDDLLDDVLSYAKFRQGLMSQV